ncbi:hypothetical protein S40288_11008 [Stachybotrys chartarum IBT 40288]|nr:hypothetical protein S40288_11008 [Stachybotrys chartarum IBT 40288]
MDDTRRFTRDLSSTAYLLDGHQMARFLTQLGGLMKQFDNSHEEYHRTITKLDVATVEDRQEYRAAPNTTHMHPQCHS